MLDLLMIVLLGVAFAVAAGYVAACQDLTNRQKDSSDTTG